MLTRGGNVMPQLDFWFDFASTYSYVGAGRIGEEAARAGVQVAWRPFLLGPIFTAQLGIKDSPFNVQPLRDRGDEAVRAGIFGAPNFLVRGELFFGQDRLEDAIAWAMR